MTRANSIADQLVIIERNFHFGINFSSFFDHLAPNVIPEISNKKVSVVNFIEQVPVWDSSLVSRENALNPIPHPFVHLFPIFFRLQAFRKPIRIMSVDFEEFAFQ